METLVIHIGIGMWLAAIMIFGTASSFNPFLQEQGAIRLYDAWRTHPSTVAETNVVRIDRDVRN